MTTNRFRWVLAAVFGMAMATDALAGVYRCTDANGNTLYSNAPCENQGAKTAKAFKKGELRPNTVKMPKAPPPEAEPGGEGAGPGGLIGALRGKPLPKRELFLEGDPDKNPKGGVRHPGLEKLMGKK